MRYVIDHDFHIHSNVSISANHPEQNKENILKYAEENGLRKIVITDHFWDSEIPMNIPPLKDGSTSITIPYYEKQDYNHIKKILPLPQGKNTEFYGCHYSGKGPDGNGWTGYTWNKELFPNYKKFLKEIKD